MITFTSIKHNFKEHNITLKTFTIKMVLSKSINYVLKVLRQILPTQKVLRY